MQNESNAALGTGFHASEVSHEGIPPGQLSVAIAAASDTPHSKVIGLEEGAILVTDANEVVSNAPIHVVGDTHIGHVAEQQKIKNSTTYGERPKGQTPRYATRDAGEGSVRARQGGSLAGKANDRNTQRKLAGPMRGAMMAAALGAALSTAGKTHADFPKAPGDKDRSKKGSSRFAQDRAKKQGDKRFDRQFRGSAAPQNKAPKPHVHQGVNRGK